MPIARDLSRRATTGTLTRSLTVPAQETPVEEGALICELALVVHWQTRGRLYAHTSGEMLMISAPLFIKVVMEHPVVSVVVASFAAQMCQEQSLATLLDDDDEQEFNEDRTPCTDLDYGIDPDVVASNLHQAIRTCLLSQPVLDMLKQQQHQPTAWLKQQQKQRWGALRPRRSLAELEMEVQAGKCHLVRKAPWEPNSAMRVLRIVVLHLRNRRGMLCCQLGRCKGDGDTVEMTFPGGKVLGHETPGDCIKRVLQQRLSELEPYIKITGSHAEVEVQASSSYGLSTKYIKTIFTAELQGDLLNDAPLPQLRITHLPGSLRDVMGAVSRATSHSSRATVSMQQFFDVLVGEGNTHGFAMAVDAAKHNDSLVAKMPTFNKRGSTGSRPPEATDVFLYQWLELDNPRNLRDARGENEIYLQAILRSAEVTFWQRMLSWRVTCCPKDCYGHRDSRVSHI